jgi:hypothetical protein
MIRTERDPAFWREIVSHPMVNPHVLMGFDFDIGELATRESVMPLAAEHGGFLFCKLDGLGFVYELHSMFTPEGWGKEVARAGKEALDTMFGAGAGVIVTVETHDGKAPPRSFGWKPSSPFTPTMVGEARSWVLTREAWEASPAFRRRSCPQ